LLVEAFIAGSPEGATDVAVRLAARARTSGLPPSVEEGRMSTAKPSSQRLAFTESRPCADFDPVA
jgi:hypothetical protein